MTTRGSAAAILEKGAGKSTRDESKGFTGITDRFDEHKASVQARFAQQASTQEYFARQQTFANLRRARAYALFDDTSSGSEAPQADIFRDAKIRPSRFLTDRENAHYDPERKKVLDSQRMQVNKKKEKALL